MNEYLCLRREIIEELQKISSECLRVFLVLVDRNTSQKDLKVGLTINELARIANLSTLATREALKALEEGAFLTITKKSKYHVITISSYWTEESTPIPFTYDDTDSTKISTLEQEMRRLQLSNTRKQNKEKSGLDSDLKGEDRLLVVEIEGNLGRSLTPTETYYIGRTFALYGIERSRETWRRQAARAKNPIRALYAILNNGAKGNAYQPQEQEVERVYYRDV